MASSRSMPLEPHDGRSPIERDGFSYVPRFMSTEEGEGLIELFGSLRPIWEQRHAPDEHARDGGAERRITRPVYWLGAWQFASLGYYAEPNHREGRCLRGEPFPAQLQHLLERLQPLLDVHESDGVGTKLPNTCLVNYYGSEVGNGPPIDQARLRMHQDGEPGPVVMFCVGQPGLLEFLDPSRSADAELSVWTRHRSVVVFSGADFKERLYHRLVRVRHGATPELRSPVDNFVLRRVSVSFRHVPERLITDFDGLPFSAQELVRPYVRELAGASEHYARQLARV